MIKEPSRVWAPMSQLDQISASPMSQLAKIRLPLLFSAPPQSATWVASAAPAETDSAASMPTFAFSEAIRSWSSDTCVRAQA